MSDRFFLSGGDINVLRQWIAETRNELLSLNRYRPDNSARILDIDRLRNYTSTRLRTAGQVAFSKNTIKEVNEVGKKNSSISLGTSNAVKVTSITEKSKADAFSKLSPAPLVKENTETTILRKNLEDYAKIKSLFLSRNNTILKELVNRYKESSYIREGEQTNPYTPETSPNTISLGDIKPKHIAEVLDSLEGGEKNSEITKKITDNFLSTRVFEVFSGNSADNRQYEYKGWVIPSKKSPQLWDEDVRKPTFSPGAPSTKFSELLEKSRVISPTGSYKFFIEKLHGKYGNQKPYKAGSISRQKDIRGAENYFNREVFAAFVDNYSDSYTVNSEPYNFLGRGEPVYVYSGTTRTFTLTFTMLTDHDMGQIIAAEEFVKKITKEDYVGAAKILQESKIHYGNGTFHLDQRPFGDENTPYTSSMFYTPELMWQRLTFLAQCCYPFYRQDGKMKEQPITRIRIGDIFDVICMFTSLSIEQNTFEVPTLDFNNSSLGEQPMAVKVTVQANIIHNFEPNSEFYGFYHRKQFDDGDLLKMNYGVGITKKGDTIKENTNKNSPLQGKINLKNINLEDYDQLISEYKLIKKQFNGLQKQSVNLFEQLRNIKLKKIFESFKNIREKEGLINQLVTAGRAIKAANEEYKRQVQPIVGSVVKINNDINSQIEKTNRSLQKVGIDPLKIQGLDVAINAIRELKPVNSVPKTIGDILRKNNLGR